MRSRREARPLGHSTARVAANIATIGFGGAIALQLLLVVGAIPVTAAWGGSQTALTKRLRVSSLIAAGVLVVFGYVIRRRAAPATRGRPSTVVRILSWLITIFLAFNTLGNFVSSSATERSIFGPVSLVLVLSCLVVSSSRLE
jgi:hypothetical protein